MDFWADFWPNFASDVAAGVILGALVALVISNRQSKTEARKRKSKILRLLKEELEVNLDYLNQYSSDSSAKDIRKFEIINFISFKLISENWRAFSDGGELQWINDIELLGAFASAYHAIQMIRYTGQSYMKYRFFDRERPGHAISLHLEKTLEKDVQVAITTIKDAINKIDNLHSFAKS